MRLLTLRAPQAETLWDEVLPIEAKELPDDLYIREWANKYKDEGLVVIGVHAPEFPFERSVDTVRGVTKNRGIHYPVVIDNNHAVWRGFNNMYWPGPVLGRCRRIHPLSPLRRGGIRGVRTHDPAAVG